MAVARLLRLEFAGTVYHLTSRGNACQRIYFNDADRKLLLQQTGKRQGQIFILMFAGGSIETKP
jgi:hypothetical protein